MPIEFLKPKFQGPRFEGHRLPLDLLRELVLFEELILETARWRYTRDNPGRKRLPRGWQRGFRLSLSGIEEGSAMPVAVMEETDATSDFLFLQHFEGARDEVIDAIGEARQQGREIVLPHNLRKFFEQIGASLHDDECIVFERSRGDGSPAILDTQSRKNLVRAGGAVRRSVEISGAIPEMDQDKLTYQILLVDSGRRLTARYRFEDHDIVLRAFLARQTMEIFMVRGIGLFNQDGSLREIVETFDIEAEGQRINEFLGRIRNLQRGWHHGIQGEPFPHESLHWLESQWYAYVPASFPPPKFFPTVDGKLSVEWRIAR